MNISTNITSGTVYVTFQNTSGNYWNGSTFEAYTSGNWTTYDVAATNEGAGVYSVSVPTDATDYQLRLQAGGSPATTDAIVDAGPIPVDAADLDTQLDAILAASGSGGADSAEVAAAVAAALAGNAVNVSSLVVSRGVMQLVAGDKYTTERMQPFTRTGWTGEDLDTESGKMLFIPLGIYDENANEDVATLVVSGTFSQTGTTVTMNFPMTAAETTTLNPARSGKGITEYKVQVRANDPIGETVWLGRAEVSRNISE